MAVKTINSVRNALTVLEALAPVQPVGVSALARLVDLDKAAVQRILLTLGEAGWLHRAETGEWMLTSRALQVGARFTSGLRELAHPTLVDLQHETGETALLFARERHTLVLIDSVDSTEALRMTVPLGTAVPIRRNGALDAFLPDAERTALPAADGAVASAAALATIRKQGFYIVDQLYPNSVATGAPITDGEGVVIASLNVVGPKVRIGKTSARRFGELTAMAAHSLSDSLSGSEP
jgi:IclR family acetate operon transcriptional repressor